MKIQNEFIPSSFGWCFLRCKTIARNEWMLFFCTQTALISQRNSKIKRMKPTVWKVLYAHLLWNRIDKYVPEWEKTNKKCYFCTKCVFLFVWRQRNYLTWGNMKTDAAPSSTVNSKYLASFSRSTWIVRSYLHRLDVVFLLHKSKHEACKFPFVLWTLWLARTLPYAVRLQYRIFFEYLWATWMVRASRGDSARSHRCAAAITTFRINSRNRFRPRQIHTTLRSNANLFRWNAH